MAAKTDPNEPINRGTLDEAVSAILDGMNKMVEGLRIDTKAGMDGLRSEMNARFDKVEDRLRNVEVELSHVKDEVNGLKADLSTSPTRQEFEDLKSRVNKRQTLNWQSPSP